MLLKFTDFQPCIILFYYSAYLLSNLAPVALPDHIRLPRVYVVSCRISLKHFLNYPRRLLLSHSGWRAAYPGLLFLFSSFLLTEAIKFRLCLSSGLPTYFFFCSEYFTFFSSHLCPLISHSIRRNNICTLHQHSTQNPLYIPYLQPVFQNHKELRSMHIFLYESFLTFKLTSFSMLWKHISLTVFCLYHLSSLPPLL